MRVIWDFTSATFKHLARALLYGFVGATLVLLVVLVRHMEDRPDLSLWHEVELEAEFQAGSRISTFDEYLALEDQLFAELEREVYAAVKGQDQSELNRYRRGSLSYPGHWPRNWNRSFELPAPQPRAGVLLLHGMSDSPYSLRLLGETLNSAGAWVIGLRLPGHGTAPSGLLELEWEDMAAAVRLAMRHLASEATDTPLYLVGYSNGGALAVEYALATIEEPGKLPAARGLVLISPAIGVSRLAALAVWQERLGHLVGLEKLAWSDILPEYDPFKYSSFAVNAGSQVHRLTSEIRQRLGGLQGKPVLEDFPPVLAFQSAVDATVSTRALIEGLFLKLPPGGHELVLFDINRVTEVDRMLLQDPRRTIRSIMRRDTNPFTLTLLTNESEDSAQIILRRRSAASAELDEQLAGLSWPAGLYSLSHVALPFPEDDPLYGRRPGGDSPLLNLGDLELRGERGVLRLPAATMLRLRWNPFYGYLEQRVATFMDLGQAPGPGP
jgi:alpha-beta hydrolase superfamily lysophospholipase